MPCEVFEIPSLPASHYVAKAAATLRAHQDTLTEPEQTGARIINHSDIRPDTATMEAAAKAVRDSDCDAECLLIMRTLQGALSLPFVKLPDYHEKFPRHSPSATLKAFLAAQSIR
ncbi:MAG: hypothetical protein U5N86_04145 [Planctomycetota bacterium]|nr:hypothetical protein [Planctomycetota bacterium]